MGAHAQVLTLVRRHHGGLDAHARGDARHQRLRRQVLAREEVVLGHLAEARAALALREGGEGIGVAQHRHRLPERPHQVLALGHVDPGLAADGGVDHAEKGGGNVHDPHATVVDGRRKAGSVGDHPATHGDHLVGPREAPARPGPAQVLDRGQRLAGLAVADREHLVLPARVHLEADGRLGDHGHPAGGRIEQGGQAGPHARAHHDRVGAAIAQPHLDDHLVGHPGASAGTSTSRAMWRASARFGLSSSAWNGSTSTVASATSS